MDDATARWRMLAILFIARTAMAFQFQMVGALSPLFVTTYGVGLADIGLLVGLYFAPGVVIALPGGSLAARFGDKRLLVLASALMLAGGALALLVDSFAGQIAARVIAGVGGVTLNVIGTKVVADWFAGREIGTAMAIYINSWPVGIALALAVLPGVAALGGLDVALGINAALAALGLGLLLAVFRTSPQAAGAALPAVWPQGARLRALVAAALIWAFVNAALILAFSFGPALLTQRGLPLVAASGLTSLSLWVLALCAPFGGILADRTGARDGVILCGLAVFAAGLIVIRIDLPPALGFALIGIGTGLGAGPVMTLPAAVLDPATRALGMGLFFTLYYGVTLIGPVLGGWLAALTGSAASSFDAAVVLLGLCVPLLMLVRQMIAAGPQGQPA
ncbi:MFS transporter [Alterinioella nitratireducens]|uniref:MFS transporter n=1 Tax=Alterinioella nitratireducens TaxID=2735915 RepID=UPI0015526C07|nr:MFS transporter [Alterinioella nitratireducens]NPD21247.1 MFS transporter [Alterinioella nitratireducens]